MPAEKQSPEPDSTRSGIPVPEAFAVIMAGGRGERFWPQSRLSTPKQLLRLLGSLTLIEQTVERLSNLFAPDHILIVSNSDYVAPMRSLLTGLPPENILGEPCGRDTAPCIAWAAAEVRRRASTPDPLLCVMPSDHVINDTDAFDTVIGDCLRFASTHAEIVTVGITPTFPSTGYGYIEEGEARETEMVTQFHRSLGFKEKPARELAADYLKSGRFKWNGGMFLMSLSTLLEAFRLYAPGMAFFYRELLDAAEDRSGKTLKELYESVEKISIDYAVMEKAPNITVASCLFDWDDVGSWTSMRNQLPPDEHGNVVRGTHVGVDTENCIIVGETDHLIATIGMKDAVIVQTPDATLVCDAQSAQRIKELIRLLGADQELKKYL